MFGNLLNFFKKKHIDSSAEFDAGDVDDFFLYEIQRSPYIKEDCYDLVLNHLKGVKRLTKTGNVLTADEKRSLGLNTRISITHELMNVLTSDGLKKSDPKKILVSLYCSAIFQKKILEDMVRYKNAGLEYVQFMGVGDEKECSWCRSQHRKLFPVSCDFRAIIEQGCECEEHCRAVLVPVIE